MLAFRHPLQLTKNQKRSDKVWPQVLYSASRTRTYDIMINSHALLPTELWRIKLLCSKIVRTGFEPVLPPWKGGVLTPWPTDHIKCRLHDLNTRPSDYKSDALPTELSRLSLLCGWRDLNPHAVKRQILNLVRLPIPPHPHIWPVLGSNQWPID